MASNLFYNHAILNQNAFLSPDINETKHFKERKGGKNENGHPQYIEFSQKHLQKKINK